ncbi:MAG: universal stress protein [Acidimicrobiales bacterium]
MDTKGPIVVGYDGSDSAAAALRWAVRQAELSGTAIEAVSTWEWPSSFGWVGPIPAGYDPEADARRLLDEAIAEVVAGHPDVTVTTTVTEGHPAPVLTEASRRASLLVVGSRGHGEFTGMLLGSVSRHCAAHAHCPVLIHHDDTVEP